MTVHNLVKRAADGDKTAQVEMTEVAVGMATSGLGDSLLCLMEATVFARLATAHGGPEDRARLASVLVLLADELNAQQKIGQADMAHGEAVAHVDLLADDDIEIDNENMQFVADNSSVAQLQVAKYFRNAWRQENAE